MSEKQTIEIVYPDGSSEGLLVSSVGPNLYRLGESSMLGEGVWGDVVEAEPTQVEVCGSNVSLFLQV